LFDPASVVPTPALLAPPKMVSGSIRVTFRNTPGLSFTVLAASDIATPVENWPSAGTALETSPGRYQFTEATINNPQRFFRVRSP